MDLVSALLCAQPHALLPFALSHNSPVVSEDDGAVSLKIPCPGLSASEVSCTVSALEQGSASLNIKAKNLEEHYRCVP